MKNWYLVAYDIRDDKRLQRVAKTLSGFGSRLQYSLFRCRLSERDAERLRWELSRITRDEDDVLFVGLCAGCLARLRSRAAGGVWAEEPPVVVI